MLQKIRCWLIAALASDDVTVIINARINDHDAAIYIKDGRKTILKNVYVGSWPKGPKTGLFVDVNKS